MPTQGSSTARGYGYKHQQLRKQIEAQVAAGQANCWRCITNGAPPTEARIKPGQPWDLGHDDHDRTRYRGPEHVACNRATAGRHHTMTGPPVDTSKPW